MMDFAAYLAIPAVNWSSLKELRRSPKHYAHALAHQRPDTNALRLGRAVHTAVFESDRLLRDYVLWDGGDRRGKEWTAFKEVNAGRTILKVEEYDRACAIRDAVRAHPLAAPYLANGLPEHALTWTDQKTGLALKSRLDWLSTDKAAVLDLKTSRHATNPRLFASAAWDLGYFHQLAMYVAGARAVTGREHVAVIVAVESSAPFDVAVYRVDEDALATATGQVDELLTLLSRCREANVWPGAHDGELSLGLPRWALPDFDDVELVDPEWAQGA